MSTNERQMTESQAASRDREIYEKSVELRAYSNTLLQESRDLCKYSRKLRTMNKLLAVINSNPNAHWKRDQIRETALRFAARTNVSFSIGVSLRRAEQSSSEPHLKVLDESKIL